MKFLIVLVATVAAASAAGFPAFGRSFAQPRQASSAPVRTVKRAPARASSSDQNAEVVRYDNEIGPDGSFRYSFETNNGIAAEAQGNADSAQGSYSYTADDGTPISVSYVADANGYQPQGSHFPVAPPIPDYIVRSIEYNAAHPEKRQK
ncbi:hypothetical protein O0L34_g16536 [Tuta absoluta]|nr:hypothetical protein O0L34_g16536 [Tuta absoluta]